MATINDTWRDHSPRTGYPVTAVGRRERVRPVVAVEAPEPAWRPVARVAARAGAVACYVGAAAWVAHWLGLLG